MTMCDRTDADRQIVLEALLAEAAFDGWTSASLERAVEAVSGQIGPATGPILFPRGVQDALDFWSMVEDQKMAVAWASLKEPPTRIREKITWLVAQRVFGLEEHREAARRAAATMALPQFAGLAPKLAWRSAGAMWTAIGDQSLDGNFYSKRATLSAVYLSTMAHWFGEDGEARTREDSRAFLDQRIDNVMAFEKAKAAAAKRMPRVDDIVGALAKIRYGAASGH